MTDDKATETDETFDSERVMKRVEELLKKAEDFRRHGEDGSADTALSLADKIMTKYSIDQLAIAARLAVGQQPDEQIIDLVIELKGIYRAALVMSLGSLAQTYTDTITVFSSKRHNVEQLHLVGYETEVKQLQMLIASLMLQSIAAVSVWWKTAPERQWQSGMEAYKTRRQFVYSFIKGAESRVAVARRTAVQEAANSDPGTALALRTRADEVETYVAQRYNLRPAKGGIKGGSAGAQSAGYAAGQRANTGDTPVGPDRRQIGT